MLDNALKFTGLESTISVTVRVQWNEKNMEAVISIKDNGVGIDHEVMPRLFTKFASKIPSSSSTLRTKKGIGLGLYISRSIIEAHGGRIWAENNTSGKGATFSFTLPVSE